MNAYDWLANTGVVDVEPFPLVEVSFKNGARKNFFKKPPEIDAVTGDMVVVETKTGLDVGQIMLSGELVRLQMRKKKVTAKDSMPGVIRRANQRDLERLSEARGMELPTMVRARSIARMLDLEMKIGDVEFQGDKRKATFYYTSEGRVDFRELIRHFAKEFKVKIEMRQIGARQESARIGGLGSCGRELCCSTWLTDFKSVTTSAARYQNLAINQSKLSGMCGRLKCCLNYELDTYMDALQHFPKKVDKLDTEAGLAVLVKTDIFKGLMYYAYAKDKGRGRLYTIDVEQVKEIKNMNKAGEKPLDLLSMQVVVDVPLEEEIGFDEELTGFIELPEEERRKRRKNRNRNRNRKSDKERGRGGNNSKSKNVPTRKDGNRTDSKPDKKGRNNKRRHGGRNKKNKKNNQS